MSSIACSNSPPVVVNASSTGSADVAFFCTPRRIASPKASAERRSSTQMRLAFARIGTGALLGREHVGSYLLQHLTYLVGAQIQLEDEELTVGAVEGRHLVVELRSRFVHLGHRSPLASSHFSAGPEDRGLFEDMSEKRKGGIGDEAREPRRPGRNRRERSIGVALERRQDRGPAGPFSECSSLIAASPFLPPSRARATRRSPRLRFRSWRSSSRLEWPVPRQPPARFPKGLRVRLVDRHHAGHLAERLLSGARAATSAVSSVPTLVPSTTSK